MLKKPLSVIFLVLLIDQVLKIYIKTTMMIDESFPLFGQSFTFMRDKAYIYFTENPGMAFGWQFNGDHGKLFLSCFRILAVAGIGWYLYDLVKKKAHKGFIISISLIFAGALGNIIDSAFYGMIFTDSDGRVAEMFPEEGGYAGFLHGKVVDMFYFPLIKGNFPDWFPVWGGEDFIFFRPIFNFADAAITFGVLAILIYQKRFFAKKPEPVEVQEDTVKSQDTDNTALNEGNANTQ